MKTVTLIRDKTGPLGTYGTLTVDHLKYQTLELPWHDNERNKSSIPPGEYIVKWMPSGKFGMKYEIQDVPGRSDCLFHAANWAAGKDTGMVSQLEGCTALGRSRGVVEGAYHDQPVKQYGISGSGASVREFEEYLDHQDFRLIVREEYLEAGEVGQHPFS